jgi:hypothetical protein
MRFVKAHLRKLDEQPQHHPNVADHIGVFTRLSQDKAMAALKLKNLRVREVTNSKGIGFVLARDLANGLICNVDYRGLDTVKRLPRRDLDRAYK